MKRNCLPHPIESKARSRWQCIARTFGQIVVFWSFFLGLLPWLIGQVEKGTGLDTYRFEAQPFWGGALFLTMGGLGIYCGLLFAVYGKGTPFPLDTTTRFVVVGPYRWVRNPMAIAGIAQGFAVGLIVGSPGIVLYALAGIPAWSLFARVWEEADLARRFGPAYLDYQRQVRCWIPRTKPYPRAVLLKEDLH